MHHLRPLQIRFPVLPSSTAQVLPVASQEAGAQALGSKSLHPHRQLRGGPTKRNASCLACSSVADISQPSRASGDSERKGRILRLKLTDGRGSCVGVELQPLPLSMEQVGHASHLSADR